MTDFTLFLLACGYVAFMASTAVCIGLNQNRSSPSTSDWVIGVFWPLIVFAIVFVVMPQVYITTPFQRWAENRKNK